MTFGDVREFFAARFRGTEREREALKTAEYIDRRSRNAQILIASAVYHEAYQDELEDLMVTLLSLDMADPATHSRAISLLTNAQGLRDLAARLNSYAREPETLRAIRSNKGSIANNRRQAYE